MDELAPPVALVQADEQIAEESVTNLPPAENFALDPVTLARAKDQFIPVMNWCRTNRIPLDEEWRAIRRMSLLVHDKGRKYYGRSNAYMPVWARMNQTLCSQLVSGLYPSDEYLDVVDRGTGDPEMAVPVREYLRWEFERNARLRSQMDAFIRQYVDFGTSPLKFWYYQRPTNSLEGRLALERDPMDKATGAIPRFGPQLSYDGLRVSTRSLFYTYLYPTTADSQDEATLVFEDVDLSMAWVVQQMERGLFRKIEIPANMAAPEHIVAQLDLASTVFGAVPETVPMFSGNAAGDIRTLTESYGFLRLPRRAYRRGEDPNEDVPVQIFWAYMEPLLIRRNPFWHQRPPYLWARDVTYPGFFYGVGFGHVARPLQYHVTDFYNQTADCLSYGLNPVVLVNPTYKAGPLAPLRPGKTYLFTDVEQGLKFHSPDIGLASAGLSAVNNLLGFEQNLTGVPPVMQGIKGDKTATTSQLLQANAMRPMQDRIVKIENDVLVPLMYVAWVLAQQYRKDDVFISVAGKPLRISPEQLVIDAEMRWLASSMMANQQAVAMNRTQFLTQLVALMPALQQEGYPVDLRPILVKIAQGPGLDLRNFDQVIGPKGSAPPQTPMPGQPPAPGAALPGGSPRGPANPRRQGPVNLVQQAALGSPTGIQPGEAGEAQAVRDAANAMAAQAGGFGRTR